MKRIPWWCWLSFIFSAAIISFTLGFVIGYDDGYDEGKGIGWSNGYIAHVKCQEDPNCFTLGPKDVAPGETVEMGQIRIYREGR